MCTIAESNVMLRAQAEFPNGFKVATESFQEGWSRMRSGGVGRLEKKIQSRGWNFLRIADGALRSGVGETSQAAIACALKLALRRIDTHSNAVDVERVELTQYPWFFVARVRVHSYRIQQGAELPELDEGVRERAPARQRRAPSRAADLFPQFGSAMPMLKGMLTVTRISEVRSQ